MLVIDADEFLFMKNSTDRLFDIVKGKLNVNDGVGGLAINWLIFGSSHYESKQPGLVTQTFVKRSPFGFKFNKHGRLQQLIEFFGQVTKEDLEWRFPSQTFPGTPI